LSGALELRIGGIDVVEIRRLNEYSEADQIALGGYGYSSMERYIVTKEENAKSVTIRTNLVELEAPYNKVWPVRQEDFDYYDEIVSQGLSFGAYIEEKLVGVAICNRSDWNNTLWVTNFHVSERHRRLGIGSKLMGKVFVQAQEMGFRIIELETQNTNVPAISFYYSLGFELDGIDLSFYTNNSAADEEVAFFMKRRVI